MAEAGARDNGHTAEVNVRPASGVPSGVSSPSPDAMPFPSKSTTCSNVETGADEQKESDCAKDYVGRSGEMSLSYPGLSNQVY